MTRSILQAALAAFCLFGPSRLAVSYVSPRIIVAYDAPLAAPVYITGEDARMLHDIEEESPIAVSEMGSRSYIKLAMFWGTQYDDYWFGRKPMNDLRVEDAGQHGRLYLAGPNEEPVVLQTRPSIRATPFPTKPDDLSWGGVLPEIARVTLKRYKIPLTR